MPSCVRAAARVVADNYARSRFPSFEGRLGLIGFALMLLVAMSRPLWAAEFEIGSIEVQQPWSRETPRGAKAAVGYLVVKNNGSTPDRLVEVTGEIASKAKIYETAVDANGFMTMRQLTEGLEVPAGAEVALKPNSFHIMFLDLMHGVKKGETFAATLKFEKAGSVKVEFAVGAAGAASADN